jgi:hypothetical protein
MMATALNRATCGRLSHHFTGHPLFQGGRDVTKDVKKNDKKSLELVIASNF